MLCGEYRETNINRETAFQEGRQSYRETDRQIVVEVKKKNKKKRSNSTD